MAADAFLTYFPQGTSLTGSVNSSVINLLAGTDSDSKGVTKTNALKGAFSGPLRIRQDVASVTASGTATLTYQESDDNSTFVTLATSVITAAGQQPISFTPSKQFQRCAVSAVTGTIVLESVIGVREF